MCVTFVGTAAERLVLLDVHGWSGICAEEKQIGCINIESAAVSHADSWLVRAWTREVWADNVKGGTSLTHHNKLDVIYAVIAHVFLDIWVCAFMNRLRGVYFSPFICLSKDSAQNCHKKRRFLNTNKTEVLVCCQSNLQDSCDSGIQLFLF